MKAAKGYQYAAGEAAYLNFACTAKQPKASLPGCIGCIARFANSYAINL